MRDRWLGLALGVLLLTGLSAAGPDCPPGFRCGPDPGPGTSCVIADGPFQGQAGVLVDGACLASAEAGSAGGNSAHQHVLRPGTCPLCGAKGESFLSFNVQVPAREAGADGARPPAYEARPILRCPRCGSLFSN